MAPEAATPSGDITTVTGGAPPPRGGGSPAAQPGHPPAAEVAAFLDGHGLSQFREPLFQDGYDDMATLREVGDDELAAMGMQPADRARFWAGLARGGSPPLPATGTAGGGATGETPPGGPEQRQPPLRRFFGVALAERCVAPQGTACTMEGFAEYFGGTNERDAAAGGGADIVATAAPPPWRAAGQQQQAPDHAALVKQVKALQGAGAHVTWCQLIIEAGLNHVGRDPSGHSVWFLLGALPYLEEAAAASRSSPQAPQGSRSLPWPPPWRRQWDPTGVVEPPIWCPGGAAVPVPVAVSVAPVSPSPAPPAAAPLPAAAPPPPPPPPAAAWLPPAVALPGTPVPSSAPPLPAGAAPAAPGGETLRDLVAFGCEQLGVEPAPKVVDTVHLLCAQAGVAPPAPGRTVVDAAREVAEQFRC